MSRIERKNIILRNAKTLRKQMTEAEHLLWYHLRAHRFTGAKFKRQSPIGRYIADFVSFKHKLIIEVDGSQHSPAHDGARDRWLVSQGFRVLRFWNHHVLQDTDTVLEVILRALSSE